MVCRIIIIFSAVMLLSGIQSVNAQSRPVLWDPSRPVPEKAGITKLKNVKFHVIKKWEPKKDGYIWLHGIALAFHKGSLYASFGHNRGKENTSGEELSCRISKDRGTTWGPVVSMAKASKKGFARSHGNLLSHKGKLWAFAPTFHGLRIVDHASAYLLNETNGTWKDMGIICKKFWPTGAPKPLDNGNWIMAGTYVGGKIGGPLNPPAVAVSKGEDFTKWDLIVIPKKKDLIVWGESDVIINGRHITLISRGWKGPNAWAYVSKSSNSGSTWTELKAGNLPMR
jgi:hypothetical protein